LTTALEGGEGVNVTPRPLFAHGKDPVPIVQEAGWDPGPVWTGAENLAPTGIRSPDRPARSQSLYRLSYPAHILAFMASRIRTISGKYLFIKMTTKLTDATIRSIEQHEIFQIQNFSTRDH